MAPANAVAKSTLKTHQKKQYTSSGNQSFSNGLHAISPLVFKLNFEMGVRTRTQRLKVRSLSMTVKLLRRFNFALFWKESV